MLFNSIDPCISTQLDLLMKDLYIYLIYLRKTPLWQFRLFLLIPYIGYLLLLDIIQLVDRVPELYGRNKLLGCEETFHLFLLLVFDQLIHLIHLISIWNPIWKLNKKELWKKLDFIYILFICNTLLLCKVKSKTSYWETLPCASFSFFTIDSKELF